MEEEKELLNKLEAALFISGSFMSLADLVRFTDINPIMLKELVDKLKEKLEREGALHIISQGEGNEIKHKMDVKEKYHKLVSRLASGSTEFTKAEQETLAIIAYKQPVKQSLVVKIRGNKAYDHIKHFIEAGLLRAKKLGHTYELQLTDKFYDYFGLSKKGVKEN